MRLLEYEGIDQLPAAYRTAWDDAAKGNFFRGPSWYRTLESTTLDDGDECRIHVIAEEDPNPNPVAMLQTRWNPEAPEYCARRLLRGMTAPYSCEFGLLTVGVRCDAEAAMRHIAEGLYASQPRWQALRFDAIPTETGEFEALACAFRKAGFLVQPFFHFGNWYESVEGVSFESYLAKRPARLRNTLRRKEKKLSRVGRSRVRVFEQGDELVLAVQAYERVYDQSWKEPEPYPRFVPGLIEAAARSRCLRLGVLYLDEEPVAVQIWLISGGRATIFKLAYAAAHKDLSVGSILTAAMIKRVLEEGQLREIDFGRGDDAYKSDWLSLRRERWGFLAFHPRTVRGLIGALRHLGTYRLRKVWAATKGRYGGPGGATLS